MHSGTNDSMSNPIGETPTSPEYLNGIHELVDQHAKDLKELGRLKGIMMPRHKPSKPNSGHVAPMFVTIGTVMDMDPYEAQVMLSSALAEPDDTIRNALKHIMLIGRLRSDEDIAAYRKRRDEANAQYEEAMAKWETIEAQREGSKDHYEALNKAYGEDLRTRWETILVTAEAEFTAANNVIADMSSDMRRLARHLDSCSRFFNFNNDKTEIICNWVEARKFHKDHIAQVLRKLMLDYQTA